MTTGGFVAESDFYSLRELKDATNAILEEARAQSADIGGAVNWGDLSCYEARYSFNDRGRKRWTVFIDEASPDASALQCLVSSRLSARGFHGIEVVTEW